MSILYILLAILMLAILIVVHEFGHFTAARLMKIDVNEFSVGFGPKLLGWKSKKHDTDFSIRLIPLGGYCAFFGEDDRKGITKDDPRAFSNQNVWKRMFVILMGPMMNFILAFLAATVFFWCVGTTDTWIDLHITEIVRESPAEAGGLQAEDVITRINGEEIMYRSDNRTPISDWKERDGPILFTVNRGEETIEISVTPQWNDEAGAMQVGILYSPRATRQIDKPIGFIEGFGYAWDYCVEAGGAVLKVLEGLFTKPKETLNQASGPIGIVTQVSELTQIGGIEVYINLLILISVNLGLMNLLPIPGLDGSRLVFGIIEVIFRKPVPPEKEAVVHLVGMAVLFSFIIFITLKDVGLIHL